MNKNKLPQTDSIRELAEFWDTHDLTDFEDELVEVNERVFVREKPIKVHLQSKDAAAIRRIARRKGISQEALIRTWVLEKLPRRNGRAGKRRHLPKSLPKAR